MTKNSFPTKKIHLILASLVLFFLLLPTAATAEEETIASKNFTLKSHNGLNIKLSELRGQVIL